MVKRVASTIVKWTRSESCWEQIYTRTVSTIVSAGVLYILALGAGYIPYPSLWRFSWRLILMAGVIVYALSMLEVAATVGGWWYRKKGRVETNSANQHHSKKHIPCCSGGL